MLPPTKPSTAAPARRSSGAAITAWAICESFGTSCAAAGATLTIVINNQPAFRIGRTLRRS